jgi:hypothetical protein
MNHKFTPRKLGTLHDGICFDYALPMASGGDCEYRVIPVTHDIEPDIDVECDEDLT